jgi:hypothetical protein
MRQRTANVSPPHIHFGIRLPNVFVRELERAFGHNRTMPEERLISGEVKAAIEEIRAGPQGVRRAMVYKTPYT